MALGSLGGFVRRIPVGQRTLQLHPEHITLFMDCLPALIGLSDSQFHRLVAQRTPWKSGFKSTLWSLFHGVISDVQRHYRLLTGCTGSMGKACTGYAKLICG